MFLSSSLSLKSTETFLKTHTHSTCAPCVPPIFVRTSASLVRSEQQAFLPGFCGELFSSPGTSCAIH